MKDISIDRLFDENRLPSGLNLFLCVLYTPLGLALLLLRIFIAAHTFLVACILPHGSWLRRLVLRVMCSVLGLVVSHEGFDRRDQKAKVLVANYRTSLDHLAVGIVLPCVVPCVWDLPKKLMWILGYTDFGAHQGRSTMIDTATKYCREGKLPILTFPEGAFTNGRVALLKFSSWPFSLKQPVQPVLITITRPAFAQISPSVLGGSWWSDSLWTFYTLYTCYHIRLLPSQYIGEEETEETFTRRVEKQMAQELSVKTSSHTSADKVEYSKRKFIDRQQNQNSRQQNSQTPGASQSAEGPQSEPSEVDLMTQQVKEVLPHVPVSAIRKDLGLTRDVDLTITNILEGRVTFTEESPKATQEPSTSKVQPPKATTAGAFARTPKERHMSFHERKRALIEECRRKYIEKHGLST